MKAIAMPVGLVALLGTIVPPVLFLMGTMSADLMKIVMLVACLAWFVTAPMWIRGGD